MPIPLKLSVFRGSEPIIEEIFTRDIVKIGRLASAHLRLEDPKVSRIHAVIQAHSNGAGYDLIDMGSAEGTLVNGERVSKRRLHSGDQLVLGGSTVQVSFVSAQEMARAHGDAEANAQMVSSVDVVRSADVAAFSATSGAGRESLAPDSDALGWPAAAPGPQLAPPASAMPGGIASLAPPSLDAMPEAPTHVEPVPAAARPVLAAASSAAPLVPELVQSEPSAMSYAVLGGAPYAAPGGTPYAAPGGAPYAAPGGTPYAAPGGTPYAAPGEAAAYGSSPGAYEAGDLRASPQVSMRSSLLPGATVPGEFSSSGSPVLRWSAGSVDAWGKVPNNLASQSVPDTERRLEVKTLWGSTVLDTINAYVQPQVTMGDERRVTGFGPFQKVLQADIEVPSRGLPSATWVLAEAAGGEGCDYVLHLPPGYLGRVERADGTVIPFDALRNGGFGAEPGDHPGAVRYRLNAEETVYLARGQVLHQVRYVRNNVLPTPPLFSNVNYAWLNILVMVFFFTAMVVTTFVATPITQADLTEELYKNSSRFAQFRLTPEQKRPSDLLSQVKGGAKGAKAAKREGKAGRKDHKQKTSGRMAAKGDPSKKDLAQSALQRLFGRASQSGVFGRSGLGGELKSALGGISGSRVGDAAGLGGLGTRGAGPGGGGLDMSTVGLGALGTRGRGGGGDGSYGEGATGIGRKVERDISISAGSPIIMGSLDKGIIRRIIKQHIAQIRYCYERELIRSPGLFGKVATQFTISAEGRVQSAKVTQSTLKNREVERCMTSKIRTWRFPKPKGGGIVIVKYPFILKTAG